MVINQDVIIGFVNGCFVMVVLFLVFICGYIARDMND